MASSMNVNANVNVIVNGRSFTFAFTFAFALALSGCKCGSSPSTGTGSGSGTGATNAVSLDWDACTRALATPEVSAATVLSQCPVCGDWKPIIEWATPQAEGGPTKMAIVDAMARCNAWCDGASKTRFLSVIDDVRGTQKRTPWKYLGEMCKAAVSAVPDPRFVSAPYFALDRIARAVAAHGGDAAAALGKLELPLPASSVSGYGAKLPVVDAPARIPPRIHVTLLGDLVYVGLLPRAHLGKDGVSIDFGGEPYPGKAVTTSDLAAAVAALAPGATPQVALLAPRGLEASKLTPVLDALRGKAVVSLAVEDQTLPDWPLPRVLAKPVADVGGAATVQDLATALAK